MSRARTHGRGAAAHGRRAPSVRAFSGRAGAPDRPMPSAGGRRLQSWSLTLASALLLSATALALSSCGGGSASASDPGKKLFQTVGCSNCHTLSAAHSAGVIGPDLDQLKPSLKLLHRQVKNGGGGMPSFGDALTPLQIDQVSKFVFTSTHHPPPTS